jgi:hypothetical protein
MTSSRPQTIQIFLPDGNPTSIKIADLTNRTINAVLVPRNKLVEAGFREETRKYGVYFLFGANENLAKPIVYIGETEDCFERIKTHNKNKDFWNYAVIISSRTNTFTKTQVKYLEYLCINNAINIGRYQTENQTSPAKPFVTESMEADLLDNYETIKVLLATLGFPIFEEIRKSLVKKNDILYCKGKDATAEGDMIDDGFVVFKGSKANKHDTKSAGTWVAGMRSRLIESKVLVEQEKVLMFTQDYVFGSPSAAAAAILGRQANGWIEWKNKTGGSIDKIYRETEISSTHS